MCWLGKACERLERQKDAFCSAPQARSICSTGTLTGYGTYPRERRSG